GAGIMRMMKALSALDADENGGIDEAEMKNAVGALKQLDGNHEGRFTEDEVGMKYRSPQNNGGAYSSAIADDYGRHRQYSQRLGGLCRRPHLLPHRGRPDCSDRTQPKGISRARAVQSA